MRAGAANLGALIRAFHFLDLLGNVLKRTASWSAPSAAGAGLARTTGLLGTFRHHQGEPEAAKSPRLHQSLSTRVKAPVRRPGEAVASAQEKFLWISSPGWGPDGYTAAPSGPGCPQVARVAQRSKMAVCGDDTNNANTTSKDKNGRTHPRTGRHPG
jgi:hypothetical protein